MKLTVDKKKAQDRSEGKDTGAITVGHDPIMPRYWALDHSTPQDAVGPGCIGPLWYSRDAAKGGAALWQESGLPYHSIMHWWENENPASANLIQGWRGGPPGGVYAQDSSNILCCPSQKRKNQGLITHQFQKHDEGLSKHLPLDDEKSVALASIATFLDGDIVIEDLKVAYVVFLKLSGGWGGNCNPSCLIGLNEISRCWK